MTQDNETRSEPQVGLAWIIYLQPVVAIGLARVLQRCGYTSGGRLAGTLPSLTIVCTDGVKATRKA